MQRRAWTNRPTAPLQTNPRTKRGREMRIAIAGSSGRMGRTLIECVLADKDLALSAALEQAGHPLLGKDAGDTAGVGSGVAISSDVEAGLSNSDVLIDFTRP